MLSRFFFDIADHRRSQGKRYELGHILMFSVLGILSGAKSYRNISSFMKNHYDTLDQIFDLDWKGRPAHTTIRDIIQRTDPNELESAFRAYSAELASDEETPWHIGFDGKVLRGSFDHFKDQRAIQLLSAFISHKHIILAHEEIEAKSNEMESAQELIQKLGLTGCLFTFDALHCQQKTLQAAQESDNEVIRKGGGNQKTLQSDCKSITNNQIANDMYQEPFTKSRNRIESRKVEVFTLPILTHAQKWDGIEAVIKVERFRELFNTKTKSWQDSHETAFYISTTILPAQKFCEVIRNHWGIENRNHYVRDVTLGEDKSRIRCNPSVFARLRSFALNILRYNQVSNVSQTLFENCMNLQHVLNYEGVL
ncbi:MAG: ISAs1 family transposase [Ardenticatenaceae bacterium]